MIKPAPGAAPEPLEFRELEQAYRLSTTGFVLGLLGFVPVIGFFSSIAAVVCWATGRVRYRGRWNPAAGYLEWGARLGCLGLLIWAIAVSILLFSEMFSEMNG